MKKLIDLEEYDSQSALEWAAAYYELQAADDTYVRASMRTSSDTMASYEYYAEAAYLAQRVQWLKLMDLNPDWFTHHDR